MVCPNCGNAEWDVEFLGGPDNIYIYSCKSCQVLLPGIRNKTEELK